MQLRTTMDDCSIFGSCQCLTIKAGTERSRKTIQTIVTGASTFTQTKIPTSPGFILDDGLVLFLL